MTYFIDIATLPAPEAEIRRALAVYLQQLEAHKATLGEPAPWPEYDIIFSIVKAGGKFIVVDEKLKTDHFLSRSKDRKRRFSNE